MFLQSNGVNCDILLFLKESNYLKFIEKYLGLRGKRAIYEIYIVLIDNIRARNDANSILKCRKLGFFNKITLIFGFPIENLFKSMKNK